MATKRTSGKQSAASKRSSSGAVAKKSTKTRPAVVSRSRKSDSKDMNANLPTVSKQTAGGIVGATLGGMVAGPVGAVVGGVAGALVGNASAEGHHPIETAVENVRAVTEKPMKRAMKTVSSIVATKAGQLKAAVVKKSKPVKSQKSSTSRKQTAQ